MKRRDTLILLTDWFPFSDREPYVKNELIYLANKFERVFIFSSNHSSLQPIYQLPSNVSASVVNPNLSHFEKIKSLRWLFTSLFWDELTQAKIVIRSSGILDIAKGIILFLELASKWNTKLKIFIRSNNISSGGSLVYYSFWTDARALALSWLKESIPGIAISRAHGWDVYFERHNPPYLPFRKYLHDHMNAIFFVSKNGRDYTLKKINGSSRDKFRVSHLATPRRIRNPVKTSKVNVIVSCAAIYWLKRINLIIDTLEHITELPVQWVHFGTGQTEREIKQYAHDHLSNRKNITFEFKGHLENDLILEFYANNHVDIFMLTSAYEGMPYAIMEALSVGIPVLSTDVGGVGEMVNNENGFLLEKEFAPANAAKIIEEYLQSPESEIANKREAAFTTWKEYFNAEKIYPEFIDEVLGIESTANHRQL